MLPGITEREGQTGQRTGPTVLSTAVPSAPTGPHSRYAGLPMQRGAAAPVSPHSLHGNTFCSFSFLLENRSRKYTHFSPSARAGFVGGRGAEDDEDQTSPGGAGCREVPLAKLARPGPETSKSGPSRRTRRGQVGGGGGPQLKQRWPQASGGQRAGQGLHRAAAHARA